MTRPLRIQELFCTKVTAISHNFHVILHRRTRWEFPLQINWSAGTIKQVGEPHPSHILRHIFSSLAENHVNYNFILKTFWSRLMLSLGEWK
jgi:hypothetical protein